MIKLYACLGSGNCFKPWLALNQLNIPFELQLVDVLSGQQKSDWFLGVNPLGVVPFMEADEATSLGESNAMLWFLAEGTHLMPRSPQDRARALQWMFFEQSKLEPFISPARFFTTILPQERENRREDIANWQAAAEPGLARLEAHLSTTEFMVPSGYSIADIAMFGYVHVMDEAGLPMADYPSIKRWAQAVSETPGFCPLQDLGTSKVNAA